MPIKGFLGLLADFVTAEPPKVRAVHNEDGSVGEFLLKWSGDYRIRWYEGPRSGRTEYVYWRTAALETMPADFVFPRAQPAREKDAEPKEGQH